MFCRNLRYERPNDQDNSCSFWATQIGRVTHCPLRWAMAEDGPRAANSTGLGRWRCGLLWSVGRTGKEACSLGLCPGVLLADLGREQLTFLLPPPLMLGALEPRPVRLRSDNVRPLKLQGPLTFFDVTAWCDKGVPQRARCNRVRHPLGPVGRRWSRCSALVF